MNEEPRRRPERPSSGDLVAGVSVAWIVIPQALAYAHLAGVGGVHGLFAAAIAPLAAAALASSPALQTGPTAMSAVLTYAVLAPVAVAGTEAYAAAAALLALLVGAIRVALAALRAGGIAYALSGPVLRGFTLGAAVTIAASQIPTALGVDGSGGRLFARAAAALADPGAWSWGAIGATAATVVALRVGRRFAPRVPMVLGISVAALLAAGAWPGALGPSIGEVPSAWPRLSLAWPWGMVPSLLVGAVVIAVVGFAEPTSIARRYPPRGGWNPNRELASQGVANLAVAVFSGMPVGGSFSRSALHHASGASTRWGAVVTGVVVLAALPFAAVLSALPKAVLAGVVWSAIADLLRFAPVADLWRFGRAQGSVAWLTAALVPIVEPRIDVAVLVGIAGSLIVHLAREGRLRIEVTRDPDLGVVWLRGVLWFATAAQLERAVAVVLSERPSPARWAIDLTGVGRIDVDGAVALGRLLAEAKAAGVALEVRGADARTRERLVRYRERPLA